MMKPTLLLATMSLVLSAPVSLGETELEMLRKKCAEQDRQISQLEEELSQLRADARGNRRMNGVELIATAPATPAPAPASGHTTYTVRAGDNLAKIARNVGSTSQALARANGIKNPALIQVGQQLKVPAAGAEKPASQPAVASAPASSGAGGSHKVQPGDTFFRIARKHGISTEALMAANPGVKPSALRPGQLLNLAGRTTSPAPATAAAPAPKTEAVSKSKPAPAPVISPEEASPAAPKSAEKPVIRPVSIEGVMTYGEFAAKHGTNVERLNELNGLDLTTSTVLAKGSELYIPAQP